MNLGAWEKILFKNKRMPAKGTFLVANPFLADANFKRAVVFITEHDVEGTMGFIINKQLDITLQEITQDFLGFNPVLFFGGPVQLDTLHFIHRADNLLNSNHRILDNVFWGGDIEALKHQILLKTVKPVDFRFFIGYSGWGRGQLEAEIAEGSWIVCKASEQLLFDTPQDNIWAEILRNEGGEYALLATMPEDPRLN